MKNTIKGEIIFQYKFKVVDEDDAESVSQKIRKIEHKYFPKVIENFLLNKSMKDL